MWSQHEVDGKCGFAGDSDDERCNFLYEAMKKAKQRQLHILSEFEVYDVVFHAEEAEGKHDG